ncbi:MAG: hypothetical protein K6U87_16740 [Firmicutes bacterium]|nr:hypothetical protein [Bacillota bacterium]
MPKRSARTLIAVLLSLGAAALALALMVGMFWVLDVLPLAAFLFLALVYAFGSAKPQRGSAQQKEELS